FHTFLTVPLNTPQPPAAGDAFGSGVALAGGQAFVGAPGNDAAAENAGAVYVFQGAPTAGVLGNFLRTIYSPTPHRNAAFGAALAAGGTHLVVGAPFDSVDERGTTSAT